MVSASGGNEMRHCSERLPWRLAPFFLQRPGCFNPARMGWFGEMPSLSKCLPFFSGGRLKESVSLRHLGAFIQSDCIISLEKSEWMSFLSLNLFSWRYCIHSRLMSSSWVLLPSLNGLIWTNTMSFKMSSSCDWWSIWARFWAGASLTAGAWLSSLSFFDSWASWRAYSAA